MPRSFYGDPELRAEAERQRQHYRPNGHAPGNPIELVHFADMRPRLGGSPLVKGVLEREQISVMVGASGTGKTFLAGDLSAHIAAGLDWLDRRVASGGVVYIAAEAGRSIVNRISGWKLAHDYDEDSQIPLAAVTSGIDLCHADSGDLDRLVEAIRAAQLDPLALVVIDTVSRVLAGGDENSPGDMGALVRSLDRLRDELRCHVLAVHHLGKDASRGGRGHSLLSCAADTIIEVVRDEASRISTATITKQRDGATGAQIPFRLRQIELGQDQDGDPVTTCVVEPADAPPKVVKSRPLSPKNKIAFDALRRAVDEGGTVAPPSNHVPAETRGVGVEMWRRYFYATTPEDDAETRRKAFQRAREALQSAGTVGIWNDFAWPCQ